MVAAVTELRKNLHKLFTVHLKCLICTIIKGEYEFLSSYM